MESSNIKKCVPEGDDIGRQSKTNDKLSKISSIIQEDISMLGSCPGFYSSLSTTERNCLEKLINWALKETSSELLKKGNRTTKKNIIKSTYMISIMYLFHTLPSKIAASNTTDSEIKRRHREMARNYLKRGLMPPCNKPRDLRKFKKSQKKAVKSSIRFIKMMRIIVEKDDLNLAEQKRLDDFYKKHSERKRPGERMRLLIKAKAEGWSSEKVSEELSELEEEDLWKGDFTYMRDNMDYHYALGSFLIMNSFDKIKSEKVKSWLEDCYDSPEKADIEKMVKLRNSRIPDYSLSYKEKPLWFGNSKTLLDVRKTKKAIGWPEDEKDQKVLTRKVIKNSSINGYEEPPSLNSILEQLETWWSMEDILSQL